MKNSGLALYADNLLSTFGAAELLREMMPACLYNGLKFRFWINPVSLGLKRPINASRSTTAGLQQWRATA